MWMLGTSQAYWSNLLKIFTLLYYINLYLLNKTKYNPYQTKVGILTNTLIILQIVMVC